MELDVHSIRHGLDTLPLELSDMIEDLVFTPPQVRDFSIISEHFAPEKDGAHSKHRTTRFGIHLLHVSRATRAKYVPRYYGGANFLFTHEVFVGSCCSPCCFTAERIVRWARSVPKEHQALIGRITINKVNKVDTDKFMNDSNYRHQFTLSRSLKAPIRKALGKSHPELVKKISYQSLDLLS